MAELAIAGVVTAAIIMTSLIYMRKMDLDYFAEEKKHKDVYQVTAHLEAKMKEFDDYKKRVDNLVVKTGFKL
jgi:hypothetical protein